MLGLQFSPQQLCLDLLHADTEEQVIQILRDEGYWDDPSVWRLFGDNSSNFSTFGNQSSQAEGPLVEKIVNSVDAVLMGECWSTGVQPNSSEAPQSINEAVAEFFRGDRSRADSLGHIGNWSQQQRREVAARITLAATGSRRNPSFTIVDSGEGQTPKSMPDTLLSLYRQNKIDVHFVQGKFNMGGTGALRFCGHDNLQLIISRRNPNIKADGWGDPTFDQWGFTIVRREPPIPPKRMSTYIYLAPEPDNGVLRFLSESLPLFPLGNRPYSRNTNWGTAIKLYEYRLKDRSHILRRDGLLQRLDILLPGVALPVRFHECRDYGGHEGSFANTLTGLGVRLNDDRSDNLEPGFPTSSAFSIRGQEMTAKIYAFKRGKAESYKRDEGIIFAFNGQTHGSRSKRFFSRRSVGMNRLENSILVIVDCSRIDRRTFEDLFMNSRDRMEQGEFLREIEHELESILRSNQSLRDLAQERQREDVESKLQDSKPFKEVLESILRKSPSLASLFGGAGPLPDPFKARHIESGNGFKGKQHPTYFRFRNKEYGYVLPRTTPRNMRSRITFETDVVNDYFDRGQFEGTAELKFCGESPMSDPIPAKNLNLNNGVATLNLALPDGANVDDSFEYELVVLDETLVEPFVNRFIVSVGPEQESKGGQGSRRNGSNQKGKGGKNTPGGLAISNPIEIYEPEWGTYGFDKNSALRAVYDLSADEGSPGLHTYYINMDNVYLKAELKATKENLEIVKSRWKFGMVLVGMALLKDAQTSSTTEDSDRVSEDDDDVTPEEQVFKTTAAIAPVLLPLIEHLGGLSEEDIGQGS